MPARRLVSLAEGGQQPRRTGAPGVLEPPRAPLLRIREVAAGQRHQGPPGRPGELPRSVVAQAVNEGGNGALVAQISQRLDGILPSPRVVAGRRLAELGQKGEGTWVL